MRGEKFWKNSFAQSTKGSPPHARGKVFLRPHRFHNVRITPACAGKREKDIPRNGEDWDHPRMRGEKCGIAAASEI